MREPGSCVQAAGRSEDVVVRAAGPAVDRARVRVTILAYHGIGLDSTPTRAVPLRRFAEHVRVLEERRYVGLTVSQAEALVARGAAPRRWVAFTFDDGFASVLRAAPVLASAGYPATVFVVTRFADTGATPDWPFVDQVAGDDMRPLSWQELRALAAGGWEIGSHTATHAYLGVLSDEALAAELAGSRERVEEAVGSCASLAYPYGLADVRVIRAAREAGYSTACTLAPVYDRDEPLARGRVGIGAADGEARLRLKLSALTLGSRRTRAARAVERLRSRTAGRALPDHGSLVRAFAARAPADR